MSEPKPEAGGNGDGEAASPAPSSNTETWRAAADKLRGRVDTTAKALGGVGMTAASAVGLAKLGDLYPIPPGGGWWFGFAIAGFVALASAILIVTFRLWAVNKPILMSTDPESMRRLKDVSEEEAEDVRAVYQKTADLNGAPSLRAYEARANRFSRIAERTIDETEKARLNGAVAQIIADIQETFARAGLRVVRRRTSNAVRGSWSIVAYSLLVVGIVLFALGTDYVTSQRTEAVTIAKSCAEARTAGATDLPAICGAVPTATESVTIAKSCAEARTAGATDLPAICGAAPPAEGAEETSPAQERATAAAALSEPLQACLALVDAGTAPEGSCAPIARAISELVSEP